MKKDRGEPEVVQLTEEVIEDHRSEDAHERKLARYASAKARTVQVAEYIGTQIRPEATDPLSKAVRSLHECGSFLAFRHYFTVGIHKLIAGCTCKIHLLCTLCAIRRAAKMIALYSEKITQVKQEAQHDLDEVMITWTVKNGEDLAERFDHLTESIKAHLQKRRNALKKNPKTDCILKLIEAAVYSLEVTHSESRGFHPHCHMVALVPSGILKYSELTIKGNKALVPVDFHRQLVQEWQEITGDSFIIDVRKIESDRMPEHGESIEGTRLKALIEVFKYSLKMNRINSDHAADHSDNIRIQVEAYRILKGRRLIGSFGQLRGVKVPDDLNDQPLAAAELPYVDLIYEYSGVNFGYQMTNHTEAFIEKKMAGNGHKKALKKVCDDRRHRERMIKGEVTGWLQKKNQARSPFMKMVDELDWI
jgi:hypothetical protein